MKQILFALILFSFSLPVYAQDTENNDIDDVPPIIELPEMPEFFRGIQEIGIAVKVDEDQTYLLRCHGKEGECVDTFGIIKDRPELKEVYIKQIKEKYNAYPEALRKAVLGEAVAEKMRAEFLPYTDLEYEKITLIDNDEEGARLLETPGSLLVYVELQKNKDVVPPLGILSMEFYRPEEQYKTHLNVLFTDSVTAFPWPNNTEEAEKYVRNFLDGFAAAVQPNACRMTE